MMNMKLFRAVALATVAGLGLPSAAQAQAETAPSAAEQAKVQALAQDYQEVAGKLAAIRQATYEANPELAEQRDEFQALIEERMAENGFDAEDKLERMKEIASQLKAEDVEEAKKQALVQEFQQERQKMLSAQREALAEADIKQAGEKLQQDTLAAMKAQDEQTEALLERLARLRKDLRAATNKG